MTARRLTVLDAGPLTTVQDGGRAGWAHLGVPRAGALDGGAADLANRLVGNSPGAALLETTVGGVTVRVSAAMAVAVTGAAAPVEVDGRAVAFGEAVAVPAGATVRVGPATDGVRSYLAVAGGVHVDPVLGSRSTDTLAWVGPPRLTEGDVLPVGPARSAPRAVDVPAVRRSAHPDAVAELRFLPGPRVDWFDTDAVAALTGAPYAVTSESNRIGLRLDGAALARARAGELPSEGIVLGAVQVPPSGQPLVFLNDHPTTGGYPIIGVVVGDDLPVCAQLRPGERVRFTLGREA
jgi:biotin-dependent carboxylase-like uncharacterized protein